MPSVLIADRDSGKYKTNIFREHTYDLLCSQRGQPQAGYVRDINLILNKGSFC